MNITKRSLRNKMGLLPVSTNKTFLWNKFRKTLILNIEQGILSVEVLETHNSYLKIHNSQQKKTAETAFLIH